jgi:hypothetical protein
VHEAGDVGVPVTEDQRSEALAEVDVTAAVDVDEIRTFGRSHEQRRAADALERPHRAVDATGRRVDRTREEIVV